MIVDNKVKTIKILIESGHIKALDEIISSNLMGITSMAHVLKTNTTRMRYLLENAESFTIENIYNLSNYLQVAPETIFLMIDRKWEGKKPKKPR